MSPKKILPYAAFASALWSPNAYSQLPLGETIGIDFGTIAPADGTNFNQFDANANSIANGATLSFSDQTGAPTEMINTAGNPVSGVSFTVENQSGQSTSRANVTNGGAGSAPFDDSTIFSDLMISNNQGSNPLNPGGFLVLTFSGLDDSLGYDLVGGLVPGNANFNTTWTAGGTAMLSDATTPYNTFEGLSTDGSGNLAITLTRSTHVNVAALTLTAVTPTAAADVDGDGIADNFEENFFPGDLTQLNGLATGPGPGAGTGDFDADGLTDLEEFDLAVTTATYPTLDPTNDDTDNDGLLDGVEDGGGVYVSELQTGTSPVNADSDGDDLTDDVETNTDTFVDASNTGTDPNDVDSDGDTFEDGFEVANGGDPTDIDSLPDLSARYDAFGSNWLSADDFGAVDINGDGLGSDGFLFFGDFTGVANDALTFANRVESLPSYVSAITEGVGVDRVSSGFAGYGMIDNPLTLDGTDQIAGFAVTVPGSLSANRDMLTFDVSGLDPNQVIRIGILGGIHDDESGLFDPDLIQLSAPDETIANRGGLGPNPGLINAGWVFFDVTQEGTYTVRSSSRSNTASSGIGGLTFDSFIDTSGVEVPTLFIETDPGDPNRLMFTWESEARYEYSILSNPDLSTPANSWPVYDDGSIVYEDIAASGTGTNTLTGVARVGDTRFFVLQQTEIPPSEIFATDFEMDDGGFFTNDAGVSWEHGVPNATGLGGDITTASSGINAWGTDLDATYPASTTMIMSSPVIDLTDFTISATLSFSENLDLENGVTGEVWAVDSDTGTDLGTEPIYSAQDLDISTTGWMTVPPQDLPAEALGESIRLEFRVTSGSDGTYLGWYIDDVTVQGL